VLHHVLKLDSTLSHAWFNLSILNEHTNNIDSSLYYIDQALQRQNDIAVYHLHRGNILMKLDLVEKSQQAFETAIELDSNLAISYNNYGNVLLKQQDPQKAVQVFEQALGLFPSYLEQRYFTQNRNIERGFSDLLGGCTSAQSMINQYSKIYTNMAQALVQLGEYEKALNIIERALELDPLVVEAFELKAIVHQVREEPRCAARALAQSRVNLARRAIQLDSLAVATRLAREALKFAPDLPQAFSVLGLSLANQGDENQGVAALDKALALSPDNAQVLADYGNYWARRSEWQKARQTLERALEKKPKDAILLEKLVKVLNAQGKYSLANTFQAQIHFLHGKEYQLAGYWDQAMIAYQRALELEQQQPDYWAGLAFVYAKKQQNERAQQAVTNALKINPDDAVALYTQGLILGDRQEYQKAVDVLRQSIQSDPNYGPAIYALAVNLYFLKEYDLAWERLEQAMQQGINVNPQFLQEMNRIIQGGER
jgi:tetratricopeptide (TPR) repeat protein